MASNIGRALATFGLLLLLVAAAPPSRGQGCSQCRDTVSQTAPGVQASYRGAIGLMIVAAATLGAAAALVLRRMR